MSAITAYIDGGSWVSHFDESEKGHALSFLYNLLKWLDRDNADELRLTSNKFVWSREGNVIGSFPITTPEPTPSFQEVLIKILERDVEIQKHLYLVSTHELTFVFKV